MAATSSSCRTSSARDRPRILIVRLSAIGDCLHALPLATVLRARFPHAFLGWAIQPPASELLAGHPAIDRFHLFPRRARGLALVRRFREFRAELRAERYEWAIDVQGLTKSGLVARWSGAPRRVGFDGAESREINRLFLNRRVRVAGGVRHVVDRNLQLLTALGVEVPATIEWGLPRAELGEHLEDFLAHTCGERPFAVVNPGTTWVTKQWPLERFLLTARGLAEQHGLVVVVTWGNDEERRAANRLVAGRQSLPVYAAPRANLQQLSALIARARLFVGNDTGPMHLAVALGVPTVAIFGATDPRRNGPYGELHRAVTVDEQLACQPCWRTRCARRDLACLERLDEGAVLRACAAMLSRVDEHRSSNSLER